MTHRVLHAKQALSLLVALTWIGNRLSGGEAGKVETDG